MSNKLKFAPSRTKQASEDQAKQDCWKVLIVDDEQEIHTVTKFALTGFNFGGKGLSFLHAYSAAEAKELLQQHNDIALALLDVVMETEHAGLELAEYIRNALSNNLIRIVLRTGQPGQAPERKVIMDYDINDYKEKTELTAQKLFTLMCSSLRSYRDMVAIEENRKGLKKIINASADIFAVGSMETFAEGALEQLLSLLRINEGNSFYGRRTDALAAMKLGRDFEILAGTGKYELSPEEDHHISDNLVHNLITSASGNDYVVTKNQIISYYKGQSGHEHILYVSGDLDLNLLDQDLISLYVRNVGIAFENLDLNRQIDATQREIVYRLGEAAETRSMETGNHLKRVAAISRLLAINYGLSEEEADIIEYASPLHDVGKIGIPDAVLNKPGKLQGEEWEVMQTHAQLGYNMLASSDKPILRAAAIIALEHHEKWDGTGYPMGKKGEDIHIYGRITAIADVYDALGSKRCYKEPWPLGDIYTYVKQQSGKHFQPELVDILIQNIDHIEHILITFADEYDCSKQSHPRS